MNDRANGQPFGGAFNANRRSHTASPTAGSRSSADGSRLHPHARRFFRRILSTINSSGVPTLVGGDFALECFTSISHRSKNLELFVRPGDRHQLLDVLADAGFETQMAHPHWLAKVFRGDDVVDLVFNSGNGAVPVDDDWFECAVPSDIVGVPVMLCPIEETIWSKAYVMERERYDGADVAHLLLCHGAKLDWRRLLRRFGPHWQLLLTHLVLFSFIYPEESRHLPAWLVEELLSRLRTQQEEGDAKVCRGGLLSRAQYIVDFERWRYLDARLYPHGMMSAAEIAESTRTIDEPHSPTEERHAFAERMEAEAERRGENKG